ncbi:MAG: GAF domain-containing protein [Chloroflexi bacterium]|nr:GAF domain-containing protein [Chloroflexota bacterium]
MAESLELELGVSGAVSPDIDAGEPSSARANDRVSAERFAQLLEAVPGPCLVTDPVGIVEDANSAAAALLGVQTDQLAGTSLAQYVAPEGFTNLGNLLEGVPFSITRVYDAAIQPHGGKTLPGSAKVTALGVAPGQPSFLWQLQTRSPAPVLPPLTSDFYSQALYSVREILLEFQSTVSRKALLNLIADRAEELFQAENLVVYLYRARRGVLEPEVSRGVDTVPGEPVKLGEGPLGLAARDREAMLVESCADWPFLELKSENAQISAAVVPVICFEELFGVIVVARKNKSARELTWDDVRLISVFASLAAVILFVASARDLMRQEAGRRKKAERELKSALNNIRALSAKMESVREEERVEVARQIHDELGQLVTSFRYDLDWLAKSQKAILDKSTSMLKLSDTALDSVQRISSELRPGLLNEVGLTKAVEWQAQDFSSRFGVECTAEVELDDEQVDKTTATTIFRILQEAMTNIARHAHAKCASVRLSVEKGSVVLNVTDDGRGIQAEEAASPKSIGLIGMRERAQALGGRVDITSEGKGTTVTARIPLGGAGKAEEGTK